MTTLEDVRALPGLELYMEEVEERLAAAVGTHGGRVAEVGADALAAGGKRLRPLLAFLCAPPDGPAPVAAGVAVELVHMATLVHDDLIDGAAVRRGKTAAWAAHGADAARATGDYLFARAFAELTAAGDLAAVAVLADASLCLARGEALQRRQQHDPDTTIEAYLERCALKTGKLFEAACSLGSGGTLGRFGLKLGIAFQIADDILDCAGDTIETGKVAGTDLRDGTPTLPLLLAAREDGAVRAALAGGPVAGVLVRVAATGALERSRAIALDYAAEARASLDGSLHREEPPVARGRGRQPKAVEMIRLGRISYVNMAPVFHRLNAEVEEVQGVPTELNALLLDGQLDLAPISSIEYARHASSLRILPRMCVSSEGAVDSIQLVSRVAFPQIRSIAVTPESATSVVLAKVLLPGAKHVPLGEEADAKLLIGDAALKSAFEDPTPHYDLGRLWLEKTGLPMVFAVWAAPDPVADGVAELEHSLVASVRLARAEPEVLAHEASVRYGYPAGYLARYFEKLRYSFGPRERAGFYTFLEMARDVGELEHVPELRFVTPSATRV